MRYYELVAEAASPAKIDSTLLSKFNWSSFDDFMASLQRAGRDNVIKLQDHLTDLRAKVKPSGWITLYHGTPDDIAAKITGGGFELTQGRRSGFMGSTHVVDNQGIFLTDSKPLAHYFGDNRTDLRGHRVLECYVDPKGIIDTQDVPREVVRLGLAIIKKWDGTSASRIPLTKWWWLLDKPEFIEALKKHGATGVRFKEATAIRKSSGDMNANTYLIFDPKSIIVREKDDWTIRKFYDWIVSEYKMAA